MTKTSHESFCFAEVLVVAAYMLCMTPAAEAYYPWEAGKITFTQKYHMVVIFKPMH